jgi:hypothetical protein
VSIKSSWLCVLILVFPAHLPKFDH